MDPITEKLIADIIEFWKEAKDRSEDEKLRTVSWIAEAIYKNNIEREMRATGNVVKDIEMNPKRNNHYLFE